VSAHSPSKASLAALSLGTLGIVFGDIGTSPLYTLKECLHAAGGTHPTQSDLYGVLSLIFWALVLVVSVKYLAFIMKADNKGEGGIFALLALVPEKLRTAKPGRVTVVALIAIMGAALLYGDGVITPAISVLSATEGLAIAFPAAAPLVVPLSCAILIALFAIQSQGTGAVGKLFGPIMVVWFFTIGSLGAYHLSFNPEILWALSPQYAWGYFAHHGWPGMHILASVVLAVTGGEALYADMGHFGVRPIRLAWLALVLPALVLCYFGQGAHVLREPRAIANPFFSLVPAGPATLALVVLSSLAAIIASQALISGAFSLTRSAMLLGYFPRVRVLHTAHDVEGQIYIPIINFFIGLGSVLLVLFFRESPRLAAAYGIAVAGTMLLTSILFFLVIRRAWAWPASRAVAVLVLFLSFDIPFLAANLGKFMDGGYIPVILGALVLTIMIIWNRGRTLLWYHNTRRFRSSNAAQACVDSNLAARVPGTAVFLSSSQDGLPLPLIRHVERSHSLHETVVLLTIRTAGQPTVADVDRYSTMKLDRGFYRVIVSFGFMEDPNVMPILRAAVAEADIPFPDSKVTYYLGRDNLIASSKGHMGALAESLFSFLQKNAVAADRFFGLPPRQVVELGTQLDL